VESFPWPPRRPTALNRGASAALFGCHDNYRGHIRVSLYGLMQNADHIYSPEALLLQPSALPFRAPQVQRISATSDADLLVSAFRNTRQAR
jgi:hypothetical protein